MPDQSLADLLKMIAGATIDPSYRDEIGKQLDLCKPLAEKLQSLKPDERLPKGNAQYRMYKEPPGGDNMTISDWVDYARTASSMLANTLKQAEKTPKTSTDRERLRDDFLVQARNFILAWGFFTPVLELGSDEATVEVRKQLDEIKGLRHQMQQALEQSQQIVTAQKAAAAQTGVEIHTGEFETLATDYDTAATTWLKWAIGTGVLLVVVVCLLTWWSFDHPNENNAVIAQVILGKLLIISILYFFLVLAARTYRANAHLAVINRHRAKSLKTFQTFATSASTPDTKNAVLLEATKCIYAHTSTGFLGAEEPSSPIQIVEILKAFGTKTPPA